MIPSPLTARAPEPEPPGSRWRLPLLPTLAVVALLGVLGVVVHGWFARERAADEFGEAYRWSQALQAHIDAVDVGLQRLQREGSPAAARELLRQVQAPELRRGGPLYSFWNQQLLDTWSERISAVSRALEPLAGSSGERPVPAPQREALLEPAAELRLVLGGVRSASLDVVGMRMERLDRAHAVLEGVALLLVGLLAGAGLVGALRWRRRRARRQDPSAAHSSLDGVERALAQLPAARMLLEPVTGRVRFANGAALARLGAYRADVVGRPFADVLAPEPAQGTAAVFVPADLEPASAVVGLRSASAPEAHVLVHTHPVRLDGRAFLWTTLESLAAGGARQALRESRSHFRQLAESIPGAAYLLTRRGEEWTVAYMGRYVHTLTGLDPDVFTKGRKELDERIHPDDRAAVHAEMDAALTEQRPYFLLYRLRHLDGTERWIEEHGQGVLDERGQYRHLQGTLFDVTRRREAQVALQSEKDRLAFMLRSIADAVVGLDAAGQVQQLNAAAERLLGVSLAEARGRLLEDVASFESVGGGPLLGLATWLQARTSGRAVPFVLRTEERGVRQLEVAGAPLCDPDGEPLGAVVVLRDVTEHNAREEEMLRAAKLESVGVLAGGIAHDFNNILAGIIGNLSLARMDVDAGSDLGYSLKQALDAAVRAQDLTRQLLTFAKGGAPLKRPVVLTKCLLDTVAFGIRGSNVRCTPEVESDLAPVEADEGQIHQVIQNLVINATQAMPEGGTLEVLARTTVVTEDDAIPLEPGRYVEILVRDEGCGIPEEAQQRIFDPYFTTKQEGTGLGLATSYSIVRRHGGSILVDSEVDVGTTFRVLLPVCAKALPQPEEALDRLMRAREGTGRILLMDDEPTVRDVCSRMLRSLGYRPTTAEDGQQALELYAHALGKKQPFDLVIMDLTVPEGMGGAEATRRLLELDPTARVVVSSGFRQDAVLQDPQAHGFSGVLDKPYRQEDLGAMLREQLGRLPTAVGDARAPGNA